MRPQEITTDGTIVFLQATGGGAQERAGSDLSEIAHATRVVSQTVEIVLSPPRKVLLLATVSWMTLAMTFSSTSLLPASPEISEEYRTSVESLNIANAGVLVAMGLASFVWVPVQMVIGRRPAYLGACLVSLVFSIATVFAKSMAVFTVLRVLAGFEGTYFMVAGQAYLTEVFDPARRGTAVGVFQIGSIAGPALGPCFGGIIVTFTHWRVIFVLQAAMVAAGGVCAFLTIPVSPQEDRPRKASAAHILDSCNPRHILQFLIYPNIVLTDIACGMLSWTMYSLLTPPRYLINPRFHLTTPLVSGLFYLAPGIGFICGAVGGGRWSDYVMKKALARRGGVRMPQDRLRSGLYGFWLLVPAATLLYGWALQCKVGALALPLVAAFFCGVGIMVGYNSLNTYTAEVIFRNKSEVMAGKYAIQYAFGAAGSATILSLINSIGVGSASTVSAGAAIIGGVMVIVTARYGSDMQRKAETWRKKPENAE